MYHCVMLLLWNILPNYDFHFVIYKEFEKVSFCILSDFRSNKNIDWYLINRNKSFNIGAACLCLLHHNQYKLYLNDETKNKIENWFSFGQLRFNHNIRPEFMSTWIYQHFDLNFKCFALMHLIKKTLKLNISTVFFRYQKIEFKIFVKWLSHVQKKSRNI